MLHLATVEPETFSILKELMQLPALSNFDLVSGTALSLKYGHRKSGHDAEHLARAGGEAQSLDP